MPGVRRGGVGAHLGGEPARPSRQASATVGENTSKEMLKMW